MIEKRWSRFRTVSIPSSKTRTSGTKLQSLRVSLIEDNPLAGVLRERTVADDMSWIITEGAPLVWTDTREMAEVSAKRTVVVRTMVLGVAWGMLPAVRTLVLWTVDTKMPLVVTLKTNSCCKHNRLQAQLGIMRCNLSGVGSGVSPMKCRAGVGRLINESEGDRLWRGDRITLSRFSRGGGRRSGHRQDEWRRRKVVYQSHVQLFICIPLHHHQGPIYGSEEACQGEVSWGKREDVMVEAMVMEEIQCVIDG